MSAEILESVVIGAGQAGLSASYHLKRLGIKHVVLDANETAGGAWQHRWDALKMLDVHGVAELPDAVAPPLDSRRANIVVPASFKEYERQHDLPVIRPVNVKEVVADSDGILVISAGDRQWRARTLVNATGTWTQPFVPHFRGIDKFAGAQFHTVDYPGHEYFRGKRVLVVGGGASAVQFLGAIGPITDTLWVTRREPIWRDDDFATDEAGIKAVALVEKRVAQGLAPQSIVSVTGLVLRPQEQNAKRLGVYQRNSMFDSIEEDGVRWANGRFEQVDVILWATGFRPAISHLAPLKLRSELGGIQLDQSGRGTGSVKDPRVQLVGYGPSASTIGANRAGRVAARGVKKFLSNS